MAGKSVPKSAKATIVLGEVKGGAAYAQQVIARLRADPTGDQLESWVGYAEHGGFKGNEDELVTFYATLQAAIVATPPKVSESDLQRIGPDIPTDRLERNLYQIGSLILAIKNLGHQEIGGHDETGAVIVGIISLAEKAGYLSDKCINLLGDPTGSVGDFDAWADLKPKESTDEAQETSHA